MLFGYIGGWFFGGTFTQICIANAAINGFIGTMF